MQKVKDSFYMALRERLGAVNPERATIIEGALRPAIVVAENECGEAKEDTFQLTWGACSAVEGQSRLAKMDCTISYATRGTNGTGSDRGRALSELDAELIGISAPPRTAVLDHSVIPARSTGTMIFWTDLEFAAPVDEAGRIKHEATTTIYFLRTPEVNS